MLTLKVTASPQMGVSAVMATGGLLKGDTPTSIASLYMNQVLFRKFYIPYFSHHHIYNFIHYFISFIYTIFTILSNQEPLLGKEAKLCTSSKFLSNYSTVM